MTLDFSIKEKLLLDFYKSILTPGWNFNGNGINEKDRDLLVHFHYVVAYEILLIVGNWKLSSLNMSP